MKYFAYGSNMSLSRLRKRVSSARRINSYTLRAHALRFHKASKDGSGKCDAFQTEDPNDFILGTVFEINPGEKKYLDKAAGLGYGYNEKPVVVQDCTGNELDAVTYYATEIDESLKPYCWYKNHVLVGAEESSLPKWYIQKIYEFECIKDLDKGRNAKQSAIHIR